jgi:hypothetical protein
MQADKCSAKTISRRRKLLQINGLDFQTIEDGLECKPGGGPRAGDGKKSIWQ